MPFQPTRYVNNPWRQLAINQATPDGSGQGDEGSEAFCQLVVASSDASELLDPAEEALNQVAVFVQILIERALDAPVTAWRDERFNAFVGKVFKDGYA